MLKDKLSCYWLGTCYGVHACLLRQGLGATGQRAKCSKIFKQPGHLKQHSALTVSKALLLITLVAKSFFQRLYY